MQYFLQLMVSWGGNFFLIGLFYVLNYDDSKVLASVYIASGSLMPVVFLMNEVFAAYFARHNQFAPKWIIVVIFSIALVFVTLADAFYNGSLALNSTVLIAFVGGVLIVLVSNLYYLEVLKSKGYQITLVIGIVPALVQSSVIIVYDLFFKNETMLVFGFLILPVIFQYFILRCNRIEKKYSENPIVSLRPIINVSFIVPAILLLSTSPVGIVLKENLSVKESHNIVLIMLLLNMFFSSLVTISRSRYHSLVRSKRYFLIPSTIALIILFLQAYSGLTFLDNVVVVSLLILNMLSVALLYFLRARMEELNDKLTP